MDLLSYRYTSPLGEMHIVHNNDTLYSLTFAGNSDEAQRELRRRIVGASIRPGPEPVTITQALQRYFEGDLEALNPIQVRLKGCSLQQRVWDTLRSVPAAQTISYAQLAQLVGCSNSSHALAEALRSNPAQLAIPCHRVNSSHGVVIEYAAGLDYKVGLLKHERDSAELLEVPAAA